MAIANERSFETLGPLLASPANRAAVSSDGACPCSRTACSCRRCRRGWRPFSRCLPLTHGITAAREVAAGATLADVSGLVWTEVGVGVAYAAAAFGLFRLLEPESRRSAVLDSL
jgi:hypothetical protein